MTYKSMLIVIYLLYNNTAYLDMLLFYENVKSEKYCLKIIDNISGNSEML